MAKRATDDVRLEIEYFERIEVTPRLTLLRVGGRPAPADGVDVELLVTTEAGEHRARPLHGSVSVEEDGRWRAAFPVRRERLAAADVSFALQAGETVALSAPVARVLQAEPPAAEKTAPEPETSAAAEEEGPAPSAAPAPPPTPPASAAAASTPRRGGMVWAAVAAAAIIVAVIAIIASSGGSDSDDSNEPSASTPTTPSTPAAATGGGPATLTPLPGVGGGAKAQAARLSGDRVRLDITGLPAGDYEAWMFNSVIAAVPLARLRGPNPTVSLRLPADASRYRYLDVSREGDGNPNHSGRSVLRTPLSALTG